MGRGALAARGAAGAAAAPGRRVGVGGRVGAAGREEGGLRQRGLEVEAFGLALPELAAATKIWRRMYESEEQLARDSLSFMKSEWAKRA